MLINLFYIISFLAKIYIINVVNHKFIHALQSISTMLRYSADYLGTEHILIRDGPDIK